MARLGFRVDSLHSKEILASLFLLTSTVSVNMAPIEQDMTGKKSPFRDIAPGPALAPLLWWSHGPPTSKP